MAIELDFRLAPDWRRRMPRKDWAELDTADIGYDSFLGWLMFVIDGNDLSVRSDIPLVDIGLALDHALAELPQSPEQVVEFTESAEFIQLVAGDGWVTLSCSYAHGTAKVELDQLRNLVRDYLDRLLRTLAELEPRITESPAMREIAARYIGGGTSCGS